MGDFSDGNFTEFCHENGITLHIVSNIGSNIRGFCVKIYGEYHVVLNNRFDGLQLRKTLIHEVIHILEDHFNCETIHKEECEEDVRQIIKNFKDSYSI